jgi:hypothetical protein
MLSIRLFLFQLSNQFADFNKIWYERYTIGVNPNLVRFVTNIADARTGKMGVTLAPLILGS